MVDGQEISVKAEYPEDQYKDRAAAGAHHRKEAVRRLCGAVRCGRNFHYKDSPSSIEKEDKSYQITISADYVDSSSSAAVKTQNR